MKHLMWAIFLVTSTIFVYRKLTNLFSHQLQASGSGNDATNSLLQLACGSSVVIPNCTNSSKSTTIADSGKENQKSNGSWDLDGALAHNPKMASLLKSHPSDNINVLSYHGKLSIFDRGWYFAEGFPRPCEFYRISSRSVGST